MDVCCICYRREEDDRLLSAIARGRAAFTPPEIDRLLALKSELAQRIALIDGYVAHLDQQRDVALAPEPQGAT